MPDPRYSLLGTVDPGIAQTADNFYNSVPDTSWMQARGVVPSQTMNQGYPQGANGMPQQPGMQVNPYQQAQQTYEKSIVGGIQGFDITKPDYQQKVQDYFLNHRDPNASQYPRVQAEVNAALNTHKELKSYMQKNPKAAETYGNLIKQGYSQEDAINNLREQTARDADNQKQAILLASSGIAPDQHSQYQGKDGNFDPVAVNYAIAQKKHESESVMKAPSDKEFGVLDKAQEDLDNAKTYEPTDAEKKAYMAANPGSDWNKAYDALKGAEVSKAQQKFQNRIRSFHEGNIAVSPTYWEAAGLEKPSFQYNAKGKARQGGPQGAGQDSPFGSASTFNPDTGAWSGQPQAPPATTQPRQPIQVPAAPVVPNQPTGLSFAQKMIAEQNAKSVAKKEADQIPVNQEWTKAKAGLEASLKKAGFSEEDLNGIYKSVLSGESMPLTGDELTNGLAPTLGGIGITPPTPLVANHVLSRANLNPEDEALVVPHWIPGLKRGVTNQNLLEDLAREKLGTKSPQAPPATPRFVRGPGGVMVPAQ